MKREKNKVMNDMEKAVLAQFEQGPRIMENAWARFDALCAENAQESAAVKRHTRGNAYPAIGAYPAIALFEALLKEGMTREAARDFLYAFYEARALKSGKDMQNLLKFPGLYRLMPAFWKLSVRMYFAEEAGFKAKFYDKGRSRTKFDMVKCPYVDICTKYGCPELVPAFCHMDDCTNENAHPRLIWHRTKTLGGGDELCDFDIRVKK